MYPKKPKDTGQEHKTQTPPKVAFDIGEHSVQHLDKQLIHAGNIKHPQYHHIDNYKNCNCYRCREYRLKRHSQPYIGTVCQQCLMVNALKHANKQTRGYTC